MLAQRGIMADSSHSENRLVGLKWMVADVCCSLPPSSLINSRYGSITHLLPDSAPIDISLLAVLLECDEIYEELNGLSHSVTRPWLE